MHTLSCMVVKLTWKGEETKEERNAASLVSFSGQNKTVEQDRRKKAGLLVLVQLNAAWLQAAS